MAYRPLRPAGRLGFVVFVVVAGAAAAMAACGGDGVTGPGGDGDPVVTRIEVSPGTDTLPALGDVVELEATALDAAGKPIPGIAFTWSTADVSVATVTEAGVAEAVGNGEVEIVAMAGGVAGSAVLAVIQQVSAVTVDPGTATLTTTDATQAFTASATDANGNPVTDAVFVWQSENHAVATVDPTGTATSRGSGSAVITATAQDVPGHAVLTVDQAVAGLAFVTEPGDVVAGAAMDPAVRVEVVDAAGNRVPTDVAVTLALGSGPAGTLAGTRTVNATSGVATFTGLWIDRAGTGYTLEATVDGVGPASSVPFDVAPGTAASLAFTTDPADAEAGLSLGSVVVEVRDAFGNTVPGASNSIGVSLAANPGGGTLGGTVVSAASSSVATFANLWVDRAAVGYTLRASAAGLSEAVSGSFAITPSAPARLGFRVQPSRTRAALDIAPAVEVEIQDRFGNATGSGVADVRVEVDPNPFGGVLSDYSDPKATTGAGVAVFGQLAIMNPGTHQLVAYASGLEPGVSHSFDIFTQFDGIAAGGWGTCAVTADYWDMAAAELVYCWGGDYPTEGVRPTPQFVSGGVSVVAGDGHACSLGAPYIFCWGKGSRGQLGDGFAPTLATEPTVAGDLGADPVALDAGGFHTCAVTTLGDMYCWGDDVYGQLGQGAAGPAVNPSPLAVVDPAGGAVAWDSVVTGTYHTCGLTTAGVAYCWGDNDYGQLGDGTITDTRTPTPVAAPAGGTVTWATLSAGPYHTCGVTDGGDLYCWGGNGGGTLGTGSPGDSVPVPTAVQDPASGPVTWAEVTVGGNHTCGRTTAGVAYCWGTASSGQLGQGTPSGYQTFPAPVSDPATGPVTWLTLDAGTFHTCGLTDAFVAYCWGGNSDGQLGDGTSGSGNSRFIPTRVVH